MKESSVGAFWKPEKKNENGPIGKGNLDFSRLEAEELTQIKKAIVSGEKIKVTLWYRKEKRTETSPDFNVSLDRPYDGFEAREAKAKDAREGVGSVKHDAFTDDVPF